MGEEFYSSIKLVTGEEIFSLVFIDENEGNPVVVAQNPVIIKTIHNLHGSFIKVKPWMEIPEDDFFVIPMDKIITMTEVKNSSIIKVYEKYITDSENESESLIDQHQTKITNKMGYISSVEDARKKLENLFKDRKES